MEQMTIALDEFLRQVKDSETYKAYETQKQNLKQNPELKQKVDEYREKNYIFQQRSSADEIFEESDRYINELEELRKDSRVHEFLKAEVAYCRMVQKIEDYILQTLAVDFD